MTGGRRALDSVPGLRELVTAQAGLARRSQLRALGVTDDHVAEQYAAGRWAPRSPTVVSVDNGRLDTQQRMWLAVLNARVAWIGGRTALRARGLTDDRASDRIDLLVPRGSRPPPLPGVTVHVTSRLPALPDRHQLPVTTAARSVVDAAAWERRPRAAAGLVLAAVQQRLVTTEEISAELGAAGRVRHRAVVRDALAASDLGAESIAENDVVALIRQAGLPAPRRQVRTAVGRHDLEVDLPDGRRLLIEVDGPQHESAQARWADARRDAALAAAGISLLRVPVHAVRHDREGVVRLLREMSNQAAV